MTAALSTADLGRIVAQDGRVYQLTPDDVLWAARATWCEGGNEAANLWTWAWRFMVRASGRGTLTALIRGHSQPVNPLWDEATDAKCLEFPQYCTQAHLDRRERCRTAPWTAIPLSVRALVLDWAQAKVANPVPRATDFADPRVSAGWLERHPNAEVVLRDGNWYLADERARRLDAAFVTIEYGGRVAGNGGVNPWLIGAGVLLAALGIGGLVTFVGSKR